MKNKTLLLVVSLTLLVLAACGDNESSSANEDSDGDKKVSVILKSLDHEHWKLAEQGAKDAGEELGVDVEVMAPAVETEIDKQVSLIEDQLTSNVDALVLAPSQPDTVINPLEGYSLDNIPVLFIDTDADYEDKVSFIGTANYEAGKIAGEQIAENLEEGDEVAIVRGALGSTTHDERTDGAVEVLEEAGIKVVTTQAADSDKSKAVNITENILQSNPNVKAIYTTNGTMAVGTYKAVEDAGVDVSVIGFDADSEAVESIKNGGIEALVAQKPYDMGYEGVARAVDAINGEDVDERIDTGTDLITEDEAQDALDEIEEYSGK